MCKHIIIVAIYLTMKRVQSSELNKVMQVNSNHLNAIVICGRALKNFFVVLE
jgi:hypothetical protein